MGRAGNGPLVWVDLLRALAVLLVLCFHWRSSGLARDADWNALEPIARRLLLLAFNEGYKGVIIFSRSPAS